MANTGTTRYRLMQHRAFLPKILQTMKCTAIVLCLIVVPVYLPAQTCCSGGVPLGGSLGLGTAESKSFQLLFTTTIMC